jgi:rare lipoprotein A
MFSIWQVNRGVAHIAICLGLALSLAACSTQTASGPPPMLVPSTPPPRLATTPVADREARAKPSKTVTASYQGSRTADQATANGEAYAPSDFTAASRTLPIGSTVKVTNPETGRSVNVRINDRGPFVHGRSLDLSKDAAEKIGITHKGVARVKVTPVNSHRISEKPKSPAPVRTPPSVESD